MSDVVGRIILEVNSMSAKVKSLSVDRDYKRKQVNAMTADGKSPGFVDGIPEMKLSITVVVPKQGIIDWDNLEGAIVTVYTQEMVARQQYTGCFTMKVAEKYSESSEATIDIEMGALGFTRFTL